MDLKRVGIYLLILFPVLFLLSFLFSYINLSSMLSTFLVVVIGLALYALFELFYYFVISKKKKSKEEIKKHDPFAD
ncbi:MAG: hypothetical protein RR400_00395 [Clostridia bacterium]